MGIDKATIIAALRMPPEQAVEYLRSKGLQVSNSWRDLWKTAHRRAFTVARSAGYDVLEDIRQGLFEALANGDNYQQFTDKLKPILQAKGWWGKAIDKETGVITTYHSNSSRPVELGSPRRLKLIYEQNMQTALIAGRYRVMQEAAQSHPYWRYVSKLDRRTRPSHRALHGRVFRNDDPAWAVIHPPNGWRCRCEVQALTERDIESRGYSVETGEGNIREVALPPKKDGSTPRVKGIQLPGMNKPFLPDEGFDYNPAADYHGDAP